ncbi:Hexosyltransferase [Forsythia ovata]|uniref:Hexosyltransferase n=1 Tax=Forsythia ovata TaxID=205694 RepID=A0ABD1TNN4_9LAMI
MEGSPLNGQFHFFSSRPWTASSTVDWARYHPVHVRLMTECFPTPNLFTCKDLVVHKGYAWLYKPNLNTLREKLYLPVGSCELAVPLMAKERVRSTSSSPRFEVPRELACGLLYLPTCFALYDKDDWGFGFSQFMLTDPFHMDYIFVQSACQ